MNPSEKSEYNAFGKQRQLRAALVVRTCGPGAGVAGYSYNLATGLAKKVDLTVCALRLNPPEGVKPEFSFRKVEALADNLWTHLATFDRGVRDVLPKNLDIVHSQGGEAAVGDVVTMHFCYQTYQTKLLSDMPRGYKWLARRFNPLTYMHRWIERLQVRPGGAKKIICVSQGLRREFLETYPIEEDRIVSVPNGVDLDHFTPALRGSARPEILARHNLDESDFIVIFTGFDFPRKGLDFVVRALGLMKEKNARLLVVGGKDEDGAYSRLADEAGAGKRVHILGPVFDIEKYYAAADCFCMPSKYEAFSLATLEAGAAGLPLVTTRINGTDELVTPGETGYFVERDAEDIAHRLDGLASDNSLRKKMGEAARCVTENFSWDRNVAETLEVYARAVEIKGAGR